MRLAGLVAGAALIATSGAVMAHHSFAMFDQEHPIELVGSGRRAPERLGQGWMDAQYLEAGR